VLGRRAVDASGFGAVNRGNSPRQYSAAACLSCFFSQAM